MPMPDAEERTLLTPWLLVPLTDDTNPDYPGPTEADWDTARSRRNTYIANHPPKS